MASIAMEKRKVCSKLKNRRTFPVDPKGLGGRGSVGVSKTPRICNVSLHSGKRYEIESDSSIVADESKSSYQNSRTEEGSRYESGNILELHKETLRSRKRKIHPGRGGPFLHPAKAEIHGIANCMKYKVTRDIERSKNQLKRDVLISHSVSRDESRTSLSTPHTIEYGQQCLEDNEYTGCFEANASGLPRQGHIVKNTREEHLGDYEFDFWSVEESNSPICIRIDDRMYLHPRLPPGWKIIVSDTQKKPFYIHPDFGSTWHCPVILPRKLRSCSSFDDEQKINKSSKCHQMAKKEVPNLLKKAANSEELFDSPVDTMSELILRYDSEKRVHNSESFRDSISNFEINSSDVREWSCKTEKLPIEFRNASHPNPPKQDTFYRSTDLKAENCGLPALAASKNDTLQRSISNDAHSIVGPKPRGDCFHESMLDQGKSLFGVQSQKQSQEIQRRLNSEKKIKTRFIKEITSSKDGSLFAYMKHAISSFLPQNCEREQNIFQSSFSRDLAQSKCHEEQFHIQSESKERSGSIFRPASAADTPHKILMKAGTASTEGSPLSENSGGFGIAYVSVHNITHPRTPRSEEFAFASSLYSDGENSVVSTLSFQMEKVQQRNVQVLEDCSTSASPEHFQHVNCEDVRSFSSTPSSPPPSQVANATSAIHGLGSKHRTGTQQSKRANEITSNRKLSDELMSFEDRVGRSENPVEAPSPFSSPNNDQLSTPSSGLYFEADLTATSSGMEKDPSGCIAIPTDVCAKWCGNYGNRAPSAHSCYHNEGTAVPNEEESVSPGSMCLEADLLSNSETKEGLNIRFQNSKHGEFSGTADSIVCREAHRERSMHPSCDPECIESSATLPAREINVGRRIPGTIPRRWELWNHPLCSLQRLDELCK